MLGTCEQCGDLVDIDHRYIPGFDTTKPILCGFDKCNQDGMSVEEARSATPANAVITTMSEDVTHEERYAILESIDPARSAEYARLRAIGYNSHLVLERMSEQILDAAVRYRLERDALKKSVLLLRKTLREAPSGHACECYGGGGHSFDCWMSDRAKALAATET